MISKKCILKPGKHQFAPGSPAIHDNDNLSDEEAEWYLEKYPHIKSLFIPQLLQGRGSNKHKNKMKAKKNIVKQKQIEDLTPLFRGKGDI